MAKPVSKGLMRLMLAMAGAGRAAGAPGGRAAGAGAAAAGRCAGAPLAGAVAGRSAAGVPAGGGGATTPGAAADAGAGPPAGKVGSLIVAVGLGGKLIRTVSFLV